MAEGMMMFIELDGISAFKDVIKEFLLKVFDELWAFGVTKRPKHKPRETQVNETSSTHVELKADSNRA